MDHSAFASACSVGIVAVFGGEVVGMHYYLLLVMLGLLVGAVGTLIGAGGGFVLVPVLLVLYPREEAATITSIALAVVFFNALSGSVAYARLGRIDYKSGLLFSSTTIPSAVLGAFSTLVLSRQLFDLVFGVILLVGSAALFVKPHPRPRSASAQGEGRTHRTLVESSGVIHQYSFRPMRGLALSAVVGYVSSLLGIGGGIIHVPAMIRLLNFPVHVATATSHFLLAIMALAGTIVHVATGSFQHGLRRTVALSIGVVVGAQIGAKLSNRVHGDWIVRGLATALALVGARILLQAVKI